MVFHKLASEKIKFSLRDRSFFYVCVCVVGGGGGGWDLTGSPGGPVVYDDPPSSLETLSGSPPISN